MVRVCFVCLGNICRSPTAEAVFEHLVAEQKLTHAFEISSAGTGDWHVGERADPRTRNHAVRRGLELSKRARHFTRARFAELDYVIAMDQNNRRTLVSLASSDEQQAKIHLLRNFDPRAPRNAEVPDPYYGGPEDFDLVLDLCFTACDALLTHLRAAHRV